jgi:pentapeptide MXKDX repeat protein
MLPSRFAGLFAGCLLLSAAGTPLFAQDTSGMKAGAMSGDTMDHGMMMKDDGMAPHGKFSGANRHSVSGGYHIVTEGNRRSLVLDDDFVLDGAPDPYIVLSADLMGTGKGTVNLGRLRTDKGRATFVIPADTDLSTFHTVVVWCKRYNVTLGHAELAAGDQMMQN